MQLPDTQGWNREQKLEFLARARARLLASEPVGTDEAMTCVALLREIRGKATTRDAKPKKAAGAKTSKAMSMEDANKMLDDPDAFS